MSEIPNDILDAAKAIAEQPWLTRAERDRMTLQIAKAILAERQRCAKIAEAAKIQSYSPHQHPEKIAKDIRGTS